MEVKKKLLSGKVQDPLRNRVTLPGLSCYWSLRPVASIVIAVSEIVCVVSSVAFFTNHRLCLKRYRVFCVTTFTSLWNVLLLLLSELEVLFVLHYHSPITDCV